MSDHSITSLIEPPMPFVCVHQDPRCEDDPCPWGIARTLCNAPADHPLRTQSEARV